MSFSFDLRYSEIQQDGPYLEQWLSREEEWLHYPISNKKEVKMMALNWIGFSKYRASLTAIYENEPVGIATLFLMPYKKVAHHAMFYLIVSPSYRKRGVGSSLVKNLVNLAENYFSLEHIYCELFEGSFLLSILQKQSFQLLLRQEGYVKSHGNYYARIIMEKFFQ